MIETAATRMSDKSPYSMDNGQASKAPVNPQNDKGCSIDFHSPEFNVTDDLNDSYKVCDFESLDGIITADMRHQQERLRPKKEDCGLHGKASQQKEAIEEKEVAEPQYITLISEGRTLIIDSDLRRASHCYDMLHENKLSCTLVIVGRDDQESSGGTCGNPLIRRAEKVSVSGAFCGFRAMVTANGESEPLHRFSDDKPALFDIVLDLQSVPTYTGGRLPVGYFAPARNNTALKEALIQMPEMRGKFTKPQFVYFRKEACIHGRSKKCDCRACADICPVGAIRSDRHKMFFNHYLCHGCGACSLACKTDAIQIIRPDEECWQNDLHRRLENRTSNTLPDIVISDTGYTKNVENEQSERTDDEETIRMEVEQITDVRMDMLLALVACGAKDILVDYDIDNSQAIINALDDQISMIRAVLQGLNLSEDMVHLASASSEKNGMSKKSNIGAADSPGWSILPKGPFSSDIEKRKWIRQTIAHLSAQRSINQEIQLPVGSPFGSVSINTGKCTLCMTCVSACPFGALSRNQDSPCLKFREAPCRQCGLCEEACPEKAISLRPRLLCNPDEVDTLRVLYETIPFCCVECGLPFASPAMIDHIRAKLKGHWMYMSERQLRRLGMCHTCRARDAFLSKEVTRWETA